MIKRSLAVVLSALIAGLSFGPEAASAVAAEVSVKTANVKVAPIVSAPALPTAPVSIPALPSALDLPALAPQLQPANAALPEIIPAAAVAPAALQAAPQLQPAAQAAEGPRGFEGDLQRLQAPSLVSELPKDAAGEASAQTGREDFSRRVLSERFAPAGGAAVETSASLTGFQQTLSRRPRGAQSRSAAFPAVAAGFLGTIGAGLHAVAHVAAPVSAAAAGHALLGITATALSVASLAVAVPAVILGARAVWEAGQYAAAVWRGRGVTDEQFRRFVEGEVLAGRLDGGVARLIRIYRPQKFGLGLGLGWHSSGTIALRPELAATPMLFRSVLAHEFKHYQELKSRGPPAKSLLAGIWKRSVSEVTARAVEFQGTKSLKDARLPALERALHEAQLSLNLEEPYDLLVVNAGSAELKDPAVYRNLSSGRARVENVTTATPQAVLGDPKNAGRYKAVVLDNPGSLVPKDDTVDGRRLERALKQLDGLYLLATRRIPGSGVAFRPGTEMGRYKELSGMASRLSKGSTKEIRELEKQVKEFWRQISSTRLKGVPVADFVENLYGGLQNKGLAFVSFAPSDPGVLVWERLLRYWEAADGGEFKTVRVDLEDGGHIMILRKVEARVGLWLRPMGQGHIDKSVPDAIGSPESRAKAREALAAAGFGEELAKFDEWGVQVLDIFGSDVGRQEIYVTIPRRNAAAIRKFVAGSSVLIGHSETNFMPQLTDAGRIQNVPAAWKLGITGEGGVIEWIDTGADAGHEDFGGRLDRVDVVHEGPEDWIGHGTHVSGISISGNNLYTGMAKAARGIMAKVFGRESPGASDGDIMGAGTIGLQRGVDVISLSLGSRGSSSDNLAKFFSQLTLQKNGKGESPIIVASAGNAGPFDETLSQPSAGEHVISVAAAAKSEDDGAPEIAFFSSVGPDRAADYAVGRVRLKPDITAIGGDVITDPGDPNVYKKGVFSAKSKDMAATASDLPDKKHTGMSGTSMAAPMVAGIALLVKLALKAARSIRDFVLEHLPLTVKAILMRTSDDMKVPVWFQGSGLVNAGAAVKLALSSVVDSARYRIAKVPGLGRLAPQAGSDSWAWIERLKELMDVEDNVYQAAEIAKTEAQARFEENEAAHDLETEAEGKQAVGEKVYAEMKKKFDAAREEALPGLILALKDPVWLVRHRAALILFNLASAKAVPALVESGIKDEDARVRQMALLALAENPGTDAAALKDAAADPRWDVSLYAAYALARKGDAAALTVLAQTAGHQEKQARYSATWLLGQLGSKAAAVQAQVLSAKVADLGERGNIRHLAAASLFNIARNAPSAVSDQVILDLLASAGPQNLGLTRTISKFFPEALQDRGVLGRLKQDPLRSAVGAFVLKNRAATQRPGALGEMVGLLARALDIPLDVPTPLPDPGGLGVPGVDPAMGALDLIVETPSPAAGLSDDLLNRYGATVKRTLALSGSLWVRVPEHKLFAFSLEMRRLGYTARPSRPFYPAAPAAPRQDGAPGSDYDLSALVPGLPANADLSLVRIFASGGVSEAAVMGALEEVFALVKDPLKNPSVIMLGLSGAPSVKAGGPLQRLLNRLMLANVGVIVPAGNGGPGDNTLASPADAGLPVVVAAAGEDGALQFYSGRGAADNPGVTWTDLVKNADLAGLAKALAEAALAPAEAAFYGTAAAAEKSAEKVAELSRRLAQAMAEKNSKLPEGYFMYLVSLIKQTLSTMPANKVQEVGAGLYADQAKALALLEEKLKDPAKVAKDSGEAMAKARSRAEPDLAQTGYGLTFWDRMKDPFKRAVHQVRPEVPLIGPAVHGAARDLVAGPKQR